MGNNLLTMIKQGWRTGHVHDHPSRSDFHVVSVLDIMSAMTGSRLSPALAQCDTDVTLV